MNARFVIRPLRLDTGELFTISDGEGLTVECLEGAVWITQSDDRRDIALAAGQSFVLDKPGLALVCAAAGPAALAIERSPATAFVGALFLNHTRRRAQSIPSRGREPGGKRGVTGGAANGA